MAKIFKAAEMVMIAMVIVCLLTGVVYHGLIAGTLGVLGWTVGAALVGMSVVLLVLAWVEDEDEIDEECEPFNID